MGEAETKRPHGGSTERQSEEQTGNFPSYSKSCLYSNHLPSLRLPFSVLSGYFNYDEKSTVSPRLTIAGHRSWYTPYLLREFSGELNSILDSNEVFESIQ